MMNTEIKAMRDPMIDKIFEKMHDDDKIFFLSDDFGSPSLDKLKTKFKDRFINVGIAEQNIINISTGLALEGFNVFAYGIAPFLVMRAYEQIRINLALHAQLKEVNVNLIGVGAGLSYDVSGPTHHCIEDLTIMRVLPNFVVFSPSDWVQSQKFVDYSINMKKPKYIRLEGKPIQRIYNGDEIKFEKGFHELVEGKEFCIVSTGYMTHTALKVAMDLKEEGYNVGIMDVFLLSYLNSDLLFNSLSKYKYIVTLEEAFAGRGGLDSLILNILIKNRFDIKLRNLGFQDKYVFDIGSREYLHRLNNIDKESVKKVIKEFT